MATTFTTRLLLRKPDPDPSTGDFINVVTDINNSMDKIDGAIGFTVCTSGTRPTGVDRWDGRQIHETDTRRNYMWSAALTTWLPLLVGRSADGPYLLGQSTDTSGEGFNFRGSAVAAHFLRSRVTSDANPRFTIDADGALNWGGGTGSVDTKLFRSAADTLRTNDSLIVDGNVTVTGNLTVTGLATVNRINESILGSSAASVTFSSIPGTYRHLKLVVSTRGDTAATSTYVTARYNGDSGANYDNQEDVGSNFSAGAAQGINDNVAIFGQCAANTASVGACGVFEVDIPDYRGTTFWKQATSSGMLSTGTGSGTMSAKQWTSRWRNTSAITSIVITPAAGNFVTGSTFSLYGLL